MVDGVAVSGTVSVSVSALTVMVPLLVVTQRVSSGFVPPGMTSTCPTVRVYGGDSLFAA